MTDEQLLARLALAATDDIERYRTALECICHVNAVRTLADARRVAEQALEPKAQAPEAQPFNPREDERAQAKAKIDPRYFP